MQTQIVTETPQNLTDTYGHQMESLLPLDHEDLSISSSALNVIRAAAVTLLAKENEDVSHMEMTAGRALSLFIDQVYWDEQTGDLVLCSEQTGDAFCLPIPKGHWGIKQPAYIH